MILDRINGEPGGFSSALSAASAMARDMGPAAFEEKGRNLILSMNSAAAIPSAPPKPALVPPQSPPSPSVLHDRSSLQLRDPSLSQPGTPQDSFKVPTKRGKPSRVANPKRVKSKGNKAASSGSTPVDTSSKQAANLDTAPTMTKSGRQIQKPTQYLPPASSSAPQKRKNPGKRTAEQALCKVCTRGLSPVKNQIVFCDGCNACWHQLCHQPPIDQDYVSNASRSWFCQRCLAKRERGGSRKKAVEAPKSISWEDRSSEQVCYLTYAPRMSSY